jgi:hypothetical protein
MLVFNLIQNSILIQLKFLKKIEEHLIIINDDFYSEILLIFFEFKFSFTNFIFYK